MTDHAIRTVAQLEALYDEPRPTSVLKELDHLSEDYQRFVSAASFMVLATVGEGGLDCSPRGEAAGVVTVLDARHLRLADRKGNNRLDSLRNIVADPRVALLFLIPGINESMRVNGRARISVEPDVLAALAVEGNVPRCVVEIEVDAAYFQCSRAVLRSRLWDPDSRADREALPSCGQMLEQITKGEIAADAYDDDLRVRVEGTLW